MGKLNVNPKAINQKEQAAFNSPMGKLNLYQKLKKNQNKILSIPLWVS